jgi:ankyrin repeat protein
MYRPFEDGGNTFSTSIHVLVSAVQKIARVTHVSNGLLLYRGLGATELPAHFSQPDPKTGCRGFAEWGFMSTTSNKAVAVQYSGIKQGKPLAMLFEIQASSVDRGACIKDFSQYPEEIEYLWVPCSFLEPWGSPYLEVTPHGVLSIVRVRVNANLKAPTVEDLVELKKQMHLASFRYVPDEIRQELDRHAADGDAESRWAVDGTRMEPDKGTVPKFISSIIDECRRVYVKHMETSAERYVDGEFFRGLVIEMLEVRTMAISKFDLWLTDQSQMVKFQIDEPMRLSHRRYVAYLERTLAAKTEGGKREAALKLCRIKGLLEGSLDDRNDLGENRIISAAAEGRDERDLTLLVLAGADVDSVTEDERRETALTVAALAGHASTIICLCRLGADISKRNSDGDTPLICAAQEGQEECVKILLEQAASVDAGDYDRRTALHVAAQWGHASCVTVLLDNRADVNARTAKDGITPLMGAVTLGMRACAELLVARKADLEARTTYGSTAAHLAAQNGKADCLRLLRASGMDMDARDGRGLPIFFPDEYMAVDPEFVQEINEHCYLQFKASVPSDSPENFDA